MADFISLPMVFIILVVLILISAFFSLSETAVVALSKIRLRHMVDKGIRRARSVQRLVSKLDEFIAAILIGNNFVNIAISAIITTIFVGIFGATKGIIIATFLSTLVVLIFCDITPKLLAIRFPGKAALFSSYIMEGVLVVFKPLIAVFTSFSSFILKCFGVEPKKRKALISEEELRVMIEVGKEEGVVSDQERRMLHRIFEFGDTLVNEVMVSRDKIVAMDINKGPEGLSNLLVEQGHSRIPIYDGSMDNILGIVYVRDLLHIHHNKDLIILNDLLHEPLFVSPEKRVSELLKEFQTQRLQIALIREGTGKILGLVTLEDLLEEIVGEIE